MVFDRSGEVRPGIQESYYSCVVLCKYLDECWQTKDSWVGLMTESFNGGGTGITGDGNSLLFELLYLLLKHRLSRGVLYEDLDDCWQTKDSCYGFMTELFNEGETYITRNENLFLFQWQLLKLKHWLSQGVFSCLLYLLPVPLLWRLTIPLKLDCQVSRGLLCE